jgi:hypothetical protein
MMLTLPEVLTLVTCPRITWRLWRWARKHGMSLWDAVLIARMMRRVEDLRRCVR